MPFRLWPSLRRQSSTRRGLPAVWTFQHGSSGRWCACGACLERWLGGGLESSIRSPNRSPRTRNGRAHEHCCAYERRAMSVGCRSRGPGTGLPLWAPVILVVLATSQRWAEASLARGLERQNAVAPIKQLPARSLLQQDEGKWKRESPTGRQRRRHASLHRSLLATGMPRSPALQACGGWSCGDPPAPRCR